MATNNSTITLNGKQYNSVTGKLIDKKHLETRPKAPSSGSHVVYRGVVDGIVKPGTLLKTSLRPIPVKEPPVTKILRKHPIKHLAAHKVERSKTLMRHAVKAPKVQLKPILKVQVPTDILKTRPAVLTVEPKLSSDNVDEKRIQRAMQVPHSRLIKRFYSPPQTLSESISKKQPVPIITSKTQSFDSIKVKHPVIEQRSSIFEEAIANAKSHEQPKPKTSSLHKVHRQVRKKAKLFTVSASILSVLLLVGFFTYLNEASLQLRLVGVKAGFHASMPSQQPAGFAFKSLTYSPGMVTIGFRSSNQTLDIVQQVSNWDSQTLLENFVATSSATYQTYDAAGRTIYIYNNGNATWVNGGIWYKVAGSAHLSNGQIINLATSM